MEYVVDHMVGVDMHGIAIITDTDSSLPFDLAAQYNLFQVPMTIHFGEQSDEAAYAINDAETFYRIDKEGRLPTTAAPSPGKFCAAFKRLSIPVLRRSSVSV